MNREIKFRAWDGTMRYSKWNGLDRFFRLCGEDEIMQYTGLKDKNGKEIYEGDIVSDGYENAVIIWDNNSASYLAQFNSEFEPQEIHQNVMWAEVMGNIYENKELIEK